jgi:pimeloyl-ACP methyl ester carboxylesterase
VAFADHVDERLTEAEGAHGAQATVPAVPDVREELTDFDGQPVRWLAAGGAGTPTLYVHGVPDSADMWRAFLDRGGGLAVDLPGFGKSGKIADGDYTIEGYDVFLERFLDHLELDRAQLVMHDWGAVGLVFAQRCPERVERLTLLNVVPFLPGYRWHRVARIWRSRWLGELLMGSTTKLTARWFSSIPNDQLAEVFRYFDQGTQRAILRLYRTSDPEVLEEAGARLGEVHAPALVVWGDDDEYVPARFADGYAAVLGDATLEHVAGAGHWPWRDRPELVERVVRWNAAP